MSERDPLETRSSGESLREFSPHAENEISPLVALGGESTDAQFAAFYREFISRLTGFLVWQGAPIAVAADLAQDTMVQAYRSWNRIANPPAWTRRVASRALVRHISRVEDDELVDQISENSALLPARDVLAEWENRQYLLKLLADLPTRQRQVLAWYVDGYEPSEIAQELDILPTTVRANLLKARRAVAASLTKHRLEAEA